MLGSKKEKSTRMVGRARRRAASCKRKGMLSTSKSRLGLGRDHSRRLQLYISQLRKKKITKYYDGIKIIDLFSSLIHMDKEKKEIELA